MLKPTCATFSGDGCLMRCLSLLVSSLAQLGACSGQGATVPSVIDDYANTAPTAAGSEIYADGDVDRLLPDGLADSRIIGGQAVQGYPMVGAIVSTPAAKSNRRRLLCTGTLIGRRTVLTAAHCLQGVGSGSLRHFFIPGSNAYEHPVAHAIRSAEVPREYSGIWSLDVGLARLSDPIDLKGYPELSDRPADIGQKLLKIGYGWWIPRHGDGTGPGAVLGQKTAALTDIISPDRAPPLKPKWHYLTSVLGVEICNGDSGGPSLVARGATYYLLGITHGKLGDICSGVGIDIQIPGDARDWIRKRTIY